MICIACRKAGSIRHTNPKEAVKLHKRCCNWLNGTWCDCQHSITGIVLLTDRKESDKMETGGEG